MGDRVREIMDVGLSKHVIMCHFLIGKVRAKR